MWTHFKVSICNIKIWCPQIYTILGDRDREEYFWKMEGQKQRFKGRKEQHVKSRKPDAGFGQCFCHICGMQRCKCIQLEKNDKVIDHLASDYDWNTGESRIM